jgi:hypothetical protein
LIEREERYALDQLGHVVPDDPGDLEPLDVLVGGFRTFLDAVSTRPATWRIILLPPEGNPTIVRQRVETNRARTLERIKQVVRWAMARPGVPSDLELDVELAARAIRDLGEEAGRMVLTDPQRYSPERYERFAASLLGLIWPRHAGDN